MTAVALADATDESLYGGKAAQLGTAVRAGLPVPAGAALAADDVEAIAMERAAALDLGELELSAGLAVRSSAVGEDSAGASFAGQHATVLNVRTRERLGEAIAEVWRSATGAAALAYRQRRGLSERARIGVVLQELVAADVAGVLFTRDPVTGADEIVIEASWGLGESVVTGTVIPDRFRIRRDGVVLERQPGVKDRALRPALGGEAVEEPVEGDAVTRLCLDDGQLHQLHELGRRTESVFGPGRDLEWAFAGAQLLLLQSRPLTTVGTAA